METNKWNAEDYANNSSAQESWANELIEKLALKGDERLLDIGCGDGKITAAIAARLKDGYVLGIDRSKDMIDLAKSRFERENLSFQLADVSSLSVDGRFDLVFSNAVLHWVKDHKNVLVQLRSSLHGRSKIVFQMGGDGNAADILKTVSRATQDSKWKQYFSSFVFPYNFCRAEDYEKWLPQAGYTAKRIELIPKNMVHENSERLKGWLRTTWFPYTDRLPENERENFLTHIVEQYTQSHPPDSQGRTSVKMVRLEVEAVLASS